MTGTASFGRWLKLRRLALDVTQSELGQLVGCSAMTIRKIEADERRPSRQLAERLAQHLALPSEERAAFLKAARAERSPDRLAAPIPPYDPASARHRHNLPAALTSFVGRERELASVGRQLLRDDVRLLTLTGPGGVGKTRLGVQAAAQLRAAFVDGVWFVALAPLHDPDLVVPTIAQVLGIKTVGGVPLIDLVKDLLGNKRTLLVLDNFEHVTAVASCITELLSAAADLKVLVTSRALLHLSGEHEFRVPPLALPDPQQLPAIETLAQYGALALFLARAQAATPAFALTPANAEAVVEVCHRLDGLPLAIELAATRVKLLPLPALLARLDNRLTLLIGGARDLPAHQQTIRATIAWSYDLLEPDTQPLFRRLAVFVGGCTLEAAEAVCNASGDLPLDVLDGLATLVDNSLLRQEEGIDGEPCFTMLETIREYAVERLAASGEADSVWQRQAAYLLALAEQVWAEFSGSKHVVWLARMDAEYANLRAALQWAAECGEIETGVRLAVAWGWERGHVNEGRTWFEAFLPHRSNLPIALQVQALKKAGNLATIQGDYPGAQALLAESLALARGLRDKPGIATTLDFLGFTATAQGDYRQAQDLLEKSRALFQELGDMEGIATTLLRLGVGLSLQGDYARAAELYQESLTIGREQGHALLVGWASFYLGALGLRQGDAGQARALLAKSLPVFQEYGDTIGIVSYLEGMAEVAGLEGQPERLVRLFGAAVPLHARFGVSLYPTEQVAYERQLLAAHAQLGEEAYAVAWAEGQALTLEQAIAEALADTQHND